VGDTVKVKLLAKEPNGKLRLSRKILLPKPEGYVERRPQERRPRKGGGSRRPHNSGPRRHSAPRRSDDGRPPRNGDEE